MPVHIKNIQVQNLGPLPKLAFKPGLINLIYGRNEKGKTYLVEFLIRTLFKNAQRWNLRDGAGQGRVKVQGLESRAVDFTPASSTKLENFWEKEKGLPQDFSRLLVIKGAEVSLSENGSGVAKGDLKKYLSGQETLDHISESISKTIRNSDIGNDTIIGKSQGELKAREELAEQLKTIQRQFDQINKGYSGGRRKSLTDEKFGFQEALDQQESARRHLAHRLNAELLDLEKQIQNLSEEQLLGVRERLRFYKQRIEEYKKKKADQQEAENKTRHFEWLSSAAEIYENFLEREPAKSPVIFIILTVLFACVAGALAYWGKPAFAGAALAGVILFMILYFTHARRSAVRLSESEEMKKLQQEFHTRFDEPLTGLALIRERQNLMQDDYQRARLLNDQLYGDLRDIENQKIKLADQIHDLTDMENEPETWEATLQDLIQKQREIREAVESRKIRLARLSIDPSDYLDTDPGVTFSHQDHESLKERIQDHDRRIQEEQQKLAILKQLICQQTGDDIAVRWETLIQNLRDKREEVSRTYKQKTAEILGKIVVNRVIEGFQEDEDAKIIEGLQSEEVLTPLNRLTERYDNLSLDGDRLIVSDPYQNFALDDLSTGAQDQVLLALRIGFAQKLANSEEPLFLILDDAFQHADWERRGRLVNMLFDLAEAGWQIFYFTMDNHIRDLFEEAGKIFGPDYQKIELN